jgi:hypothetical protein
VYCFGDPKKMSDPNVKLALRVHDECNGSDVFGSDICTCRPYLLFGIEEAVKEAQSGGSGVVIYFRKEGRALGEVTKVGISVLFITVELWLTYRAVPCLQCPYVRALVFNISTIAVWAIAYRDEQENVGLTGPVITSRGESSLLLID